MANRRKVIAISTGDATVAVQERKKLEETAVKAPRTGLQKVPSDALVNEVAKKEYKRVLKLLEAIDIISDVDRANLIVYANAYARYLDAIKALKTEPLVIEAATGPKKNPWITVSESAYAEMYRAGSALGMTVDSRLKAGAVKVRKQEENLEAAFGDI